MDTELIDFIIDLLAGSKYSSNGKVNLREIMENIEAKPSSEAGKIAYRRGGDTWYKLTSRRFLTRLLKLNEVYPDSVLDIFSAKIDKYLGTDVAAEVQLVKGQAVQTAYSRCVGGKSCMTGDCSDYVGLYRDNPKKVRLAVARIGNESARALVWSTDKGLWFDRIYANSQRAEDLLETRLESHGIYSVYTDNPSVSVRGLLYTDGEIPYMDSLHYGAINNRYLDISTDEGDLNLQTCNGYLEESNFCVGCDERLSDDESYWVGDECYCEYCYTENFFLCDKCGEGCCNEDATEVNHLNRTYNVCPTCRNDNCVDCNCCGETHYMEDMTFIKYGSEFVCKECFAENYTTCDDCGELYYLEDLTTTKSDRRVCRDCEDNYTACDICGILDKSDNLKDGFCTDCGLSPLLDNIRPWLLK